jgi:hypothetical protein
VKTISIWDSTTRYRTLRLEDAEHQPADRFGPAYTPERLRLTYNDPQSDGNWRLVAADIEGHEFAPVFLHFKEPALNELRGYQLLDWVPTWVAQIALRFLPGPGGPEPEHGADQGIRPFDPTDPITPVPESNPLPQPYPFQFPRPIAADPVPPVVVVSDAPPRVHVSEGQSWVSSTNTAAPPQDPFAQPLPHLGSLPPGEYQAVVTPDPQDPGNSNLFKAAEVRSLNGQPLPVTWGSDQSQNPRGSSFTQGATVITQKFSELDDATQIRPSKEFPHGA